MRNRHKGFLLLDYGEFELLATKILLHDYCQEKEFLCGKCTVNNSMLGLVMKLMQADPEEGVSKLGFWDPNTEKLDIFDKKSLIQMTSRFIY